MEGADEATQMVGWVGIDVTTVDTMGVEGDGPDTNDPSEGADVPNHTRF